MDKRYSVHPSAKHTAFATVKDALSGHHICSAIEDDAELIAEALNEHWARVQAVQEELQARIYRGELEATDADGVDTMGNQG